MPMTSESSKPSSPSKPLDVTEQYFTDPAFRERHEAQLVCVCYPVKHFSEKTGRSYTPSVRKQFDEHWQPVQKGHPKYLQCRIYLVDNRKALASLLKQINKNSQMFFVPGLPDPNRWDWQTEDQVNRRTKDMFLPDRKSHWCVLDLDELHVNGWTPDHGIGGTVNLVAADLSRLLDQPDEAIKAASIFYLSSSYGNPSKTTPRLHVYVWHRRPITLKDVDRLLKGLNKGKKKNVDPAMSQPGRIIYTAAPKVPESAVRQLDSELQELFADPSQRIKLFKGDGAGLDLRKLIKSFPETVHDHSRPASPGSPAAIRLVAEKLDELGIVKAKHGDIWHVECPWGPHASGDEADNKTSLNLTGKGWVFRCQHENTHEPKKFTDLERWLIEEEHLTQQELNEVRHEAARKEAYREFSPPKLIDLKSELETYLDKHRNDYGPRQHLKNICQRLADHDLSRDQLEQLFNLVAGRKIGGVKYEQLRDYFDKHHGLPADDKHPTESGHLVVPRDEEIPPETFPDIRLTGRTTKLKLTSENVQHLLDCYQIKAVYDVFSKQPVFLGFDYDAKVMRDGMRDALIFDVESLAARSNFEAKKEVSAIAAALAYKNPINPIMEYIKAIEWDGKDHLQELADCLTVIDKDQYLRDVVLKRWLIQAIAAADGAENTPNGEAQPKYEYVLTLVGAQGISKGKFLRALVPKPLSNYYKDGLNINPRDKDSREAAISYWMVELGELDRTITVKNTSDMKAFLSEEADTFRKSYGRAPNEFVRRTVFSGSVNDPKFLRDKTGNRRYLPVDVINIRLPDHVDMDQVWAQVHDLYLQGEQWWPTPEEEHWLDRHRQHFLPADEAPIIQSVMDMFGPITVERKAMPGSQWLTATHIAKLALDDPHLNPRSQEVEALLGWLPYRNKNKHGKPDTKNRHGMELWLMPPLLAEQQDGLRDETPKKVKRRRPTPVDHIPAREEFQVWSDQIH